MQGRGAPAQVLQQWWVCQCSSLRFASSVGYKEDIKWEASSSCVLQSLIDRSLQACPLLRKLNPRRWTQGHDSQVEGQVEGGS